MLLNAPLAAFPTGNKHNTIRGIAQRLSGFGWRFFIQVNGFDFCLIEKKQMYWDPGLTQI